MITVRAFCHGPAATNSYLLVDEKTRRGAIIDAPAGSAELMVAAAQEAQATVEKILLTHSHWDHIADVAKLATTLSVPVCCHLEDADNVRRPGADGLSLFIPVVPHSPEVILADGDEVSVGEATLRVIHTPGHSPGGVCFYDEEDGLLFSGDTLFSRSIGNLSLPSAEPDRMWPSLSRLAQLPPEVVVYPGHGEETRIGKEDWLPDAKRIFG